MLHTKLNVFFLFVSAKEATGKLELEVNEARSMLGKRNEEFELKVKEVTKLREFIKTAEQEKSQELDKVLSFTR